MAFPFQLPRMRASFRRLRGVYGSIIPPSVTSAKVTEAPIPDSTPPEEGDETAATIC
jgi:hypothetical protein